jgi:hypothetical protein
MILISEKFCKLRDIQVNNTIDKKIERLWRKGLKNAIKCELFEFLVPSYKNFSDEWGCYR